VGDPSRQRGFELGYDAGPRAGNEDKAKNKNPNPYLRPEYMNAEQFYRYEFGSRALFIEGFHTGFLRGYKSSFSKMDLKQEDTTRKTASVPYPHSRQAGVENVKIRQIPHEKITFAEDAL